MKRHLKHQDAHWKDLDLAKVAWEQKLMQNFCDDSERQGNRSAWSPRPWEVSIRSEPKQAWFHQRNSLKDCNALLQLKSNFPVIDTLKFLREKLKKVSNTSKKVPLDTKQVFREN